MSSEQLYEEYLLNNPAGERAIEVAHISHSLISRDYWICREPEGLTLGLDGGSIFAEGRNMEIKRATTTDDLDERFTFNFSDPDGILQDEAAMIPLDNEEPVQIQYYVWMASDLSQPAIGPVLLFATLFTPTLEAARIDASVPSLAENRTGELYTYERFPSLRGFL